MNARREWQTKFPDLYDACHDCRYRRLCRITDQVIVFYHENQPVSDDGTGLPYERDLVALDKNFVLRVAYRLQDLIGKHCPARLTDEYLRRQSAIINNI